MEKKLRLIQGNERSLQSACDKRCQVENRGRFCNHLFFYTSRGLLQKRQIAGELGTPIVLLFLFYSTLHIGQKAGNTLLTGCSACYSSIVGECYVLVVRWQFVSIVMLLIRLKLLQSWASILASQRKSNPSCCSHPNKGHGEGRYAY